MTDSNYHGEWISLSTKHKDGVNFVSYGAQTPGAVTRTDNGAGDIRFMELIGMSDTTSVGSDDLFTHLGIMSGVSDIDADGVKYIKSVGEYDWNFLGFINAPNYTAYGTYKVLYTLEEIINNINSHFQSIGYKYRSVASNYLNNNRLRITSFNKGQFGYIGIKAYDDGEAGSLESSLVGELIFGYRESRDSHISLYGIGVKVTTRQLEIAIEIDGEDEELMLKLETHPNPDLKISVENYSDHTLEIHEADKLEQIIEVVPQ